MQNNGLVAKRLVAFSADRKTRVVELSEATIGGMTFAVQRFFAAKYEVERWHTAGVTNTEPKARMIFAEVEDMVAAGKAGSISYSGMVDKEGRAVA